MEEKKIKIMELLACTIGIPEFKYFDLESNELLDEKIEVLEAIKEGKAPIDIPNYYTILELLPKEGIWD